MLDLGIVNRSNYYTGVIFHGYAQGSGLSVLSGGRYDNLLGEFGMQAPAIGFAVEVSALCEAMRETINVERPIRIALTKGRLEKSSVALFRTMGLDTSNLENKGRRLILPVDKYEAVLSKAPDVITYVEHGVCDIGIVGKDTIVENGSSFYEVLDLGIGKCRFALACPKGSDFFSGYKRKVGASKYPKVAKEFFESKGMDVAIIKIEGSVELAPLLGLADGIVDIVETGSTLKENGLEVVEEILPISARVIVNMASMKLRKAEIESFLNDLELASQV
jgi:ATP phosphoribosyltransferase regulatory subunit